MRMLDVREKAQTRGLWEESFPQDTKPFLDYYYSERIRTNRIFVEEEKGETTAMIHLNPFRMVAKGVSFEVPYMMGIATRQDCRDRGVMTGLMTATLNRLAAEHVPFTFLIPNGETFYDRFGFRYVANDREIGLPDPKIGLTERPVKKHELAELASFANICLAGLFDAYMLRSKAYFETLQKSLRTNGGDVMVLEDSEGHLAGFYYYQMKNGERSIVECFALPAICPKAAEKGPLVLARICSLQTFARILFAREPISVPLEVKDGLIAANNGRIRIRCDRDRTIIVRAETEQEKAEPAVKIAIEDLSQWIFGFKKLEELIAEGTVSGEKEQLTKLANIHPIHHALIKEII